MSPAADRPVLLAVDLGTTSSRAALSVAGAAPRLLALPQGPDGSTRSALGSGVYLPADGRLLVGTEALRAGRSDPARYEPHPKLRASEGQLLLGDDVLAVADALRAALLLWVRRAREDCGGSGPDELVLTHPAGWQASQRAVLQQAAQGLAPRLRLVPEPVAAASYYTSGAGQPRLPGTCAVLDLGGGTADATVLGRFQDRLQVLATLGDAHIGGADIDRMLLEQLTSSALPEDAAGDRPVLGGSSSLDRGWLLAALEEVRSAKEALSDRERVQVRLPGWETARSLERSELERVIAPSARRMAGLAPEALRAAGVSTGLDVLYLVGGTSRIPAVAEAVGAACRIAPHADGRPESVVALGALFQAGARSGGVGTRARAGTPPPEGTPDTLATGAARKRRFHVRVPVAVLATAVGLIVTVAVLVFALWGLPWSGPGGPAGGSTGQSWSSGPQPRSQTSTATRVLAQYDYRFAVPAGWHQSGGDTTTRTVVLVPESPVVSDQSGIRVAEQRLSYDGTRNRARVVRELAAQFSADPHGRFTQFDSTARYAGRRAVHYRERLPDATVDWYVLLRGRAQVNVGCRRPEAIAAERAAAARRACHQVVATMQIRP